ncbi:glutamate racemase [Ideonella sp. YS5]|uniref:glutamate racemase n=1 Tax=Ideonella sp. YS5 TaxID=3453714 RepID=UPI003EEB4D1E
MAIGDEPQQPLDRLCAAMLHSHPSRPLIGIFDSGVGGLSVLRALHQRMPACPMLYIADAGHAPYGDRDPGHVIERSQRVVDHLVDQGAQLIVIACNTATAWAIDAMRIRHPQIPFVGVEPGVKPAALMSPSGRFAVMATPATLASARFASLVARHAAHCTVHPVPCAGLATAIERGDTGATEVERLLDLYCLPLTQLDIDTVVLGCTHYPFVMERIAARLAPRTQVLDTADAIARRVVELMAAPVADTGSRLLRLCTTGMPEALQRMARGGLQVEAEVEQIQL